jgi:hypothetical protein
VKSVGVAGVEDLAGAAEYDGQDPGVAGQPSCGGGRQALTVSALLIGSRRRHRHADAARSSGA